MGGKGGSEEPDLCKIAVLGVGVETLLIPLSLSLSLSLSQSLSLSLPPSLSLSLSLRPTGHCTQLYRDYTSSASLDPQWSPYYTDCLWSKLLSCAVK